jgi:O-antigen ligase
MCLICFSAAVATTLDCRVSRTERRVAFIASIIALVVPVSLGKLGPLIACAVGGIAAVYVGRFWRTHRLGTAVSVAGLILWVTVLMTQPIGQESRIRRLADDENFLARLDLFAATAAGLKTIDPFMGAGAGGIAYYLAGSDKTAYPHNVIIEVVFDGGIAGALLFCAPLILASRRLRGVSHRSDRAFLTYLVVMAAVNALCSGDVAHNELLWVSSGMVVGSHEVGTLVSQEHSPPTSQGA